MKPDAPGEYRGIWRPIPTRVPGFDITEMFPKQAMHTDHFSVVRSLHHGTGDHFAGMHRMLTGKDMGVGTANRSPKFPSIGSLASHQLGSRQQGMPAYAVAPSSRNFYLGAHMLGSEHNPFMPEGDPNAAKYDVRNLNLAQGLSLQRLEDRRLLSRRLDQGARGLETDSVASTMDRYTSEAFDFVVSGKARKAFDIAEEPAKTREQYGRHTWGQSMLLARRLVEAGTTFVTVFLAGWDSHWDLQSRMEHHLPIVDAGVSALFQDLDQRGMLESTLVVLCGEFSRTPTMNNGGNGGPAGSMGTPGRDHWGNAMFCLLGGGGVKGGRIVGSTDRLGIAPQTRAVTPSNIHATIYRVLGIDPGLQLRDSAGRPVNALDDRTSIDELF